MRAALRRWRRHGLAFAVGVALAAGSAGYDWTAADSAARQVWPAFGLVVGLLLIGVVAAEEGLFAASGARLARSASRSLLLFIGMGALIVVVSAVLNLDTSVTFLTPVAVHAGKARRQDVGYLLAACLLLSNAGSILLPGSNLTNVIVLGGSRLSGGAFLARMLLPWLVAVAITMLVIGFTCRAALRQRVETVLEAPTRRPGAGLTAVIVSAVLVIGLKSPALPVLSVGVAVALLRLGQRRIEGRTVGRVLSLPVLVLLFGLAVFGGTVGRVWNGPVSALAHLGPTATAGAAALVALFINNLPAAAVLSAHVPVHPLSLLIGLDVGPNLFVTGSLAWTLWIGAVRNAGEEVPLKSTVIMGLVSAPLAMAASVAALHLSHGWS